MLDKLRRTYSIVRKLGGGEFGDIYLGVNKNTDRNVAIKVGEDIDGILINNEAKVYNVLGDEKGFPKMRLYGREDNYSYIVMDLLGISLSKKKEEEGSFNINEVVRVGIIILRKLEILHNKGYLHRDMKPDNIMYGLDQDKDVYLIDYGLSCGYIRGGVHVENERTGRMIGTTRYASINLHNGYRPTRRDDIEGLGYVLLYLLVDKLPWQDIGGEDDAKRLKMVKKIKEDENLLDIYKELPIELLGIINYARKLKYNEKPNYDYLVGLLKNLQEIIHKST